MPAKKPSRTSKAARPARARPAPSRTPARPARTSAPADGARSASQTGAVGAFLASLDHPLKPVVEQLRRLVLSVDPSICEGIKWNSPSFRTSDWFATMNLRARAGADRLWLILHTGASKKPGRKPRSAITDPGSLLEWLADDRALVVFNDAKDLRSRSAALRALIREWIALLPPAPEHAD